MATILKIDGRSAAAKHFLAFAKTLPFVKTEKTGLGKPGVEDIYDPEFVKKIRRAEKQIKKGEYTVVDPKDVWGSLGL